MHDNRKVREAKITVGIEIYVPERPLTGEQLKKIQCKKLSSLYTQKLAKNRKHFYGKSSEVSRHAFLTSNRPDLV